MTSTLCLCYVADDGTLGCRDPPRRAEGCVGPGQWLESQLTQLLVWCVRLDRDPAHSAGRFGQQVASLVLWFGLDDWVIDQINRDATRTLMPSLLRVNDPAEGNLLPKYYQLQPTARIVFCVLAFRSHQQAYFLTYPLSHRPYSFLSTDYRDFFCLYLVSNIGFPLYPQVYS